LNKLKKALSEPKEENFSKLFDRSDVIEEFYILYKKAREYLLRNITGIPEEEKREEFVDNFMMQMLTLWYLQERGFFNNDKNYFITKFKESKQKKLFGEFKNYYEFLTYFFEKVSDNLDSQYYEDKIVGKVVVIGPAVFLNGEHSKAISIPDKCFYKEEMTDILINTPPKKVSQEVPLLNLFESRDWTEGNIDEFVLGAIYEKLITYMERKKLGAYYTPEEITSYICKNTIEPYLVDRVNENFKKNFETIDQVIENADKDVLLYLFNELKEIKILDPAVGSAHFLESAINVLVNIYEKIRERARELDIRRGLKITATDEKGEIKEIDLLEISDEDEFKLLVKFFIILSKNIYGVDINPSALKVAKARLFLTLAKHFKVGKEKDIFIRFPNVHFNLREGNSLIGYVELGKEKQKGQLQLDLFIKEEHAEYITERIKVVSELKPYLETTAKALKIDGDIIKEIEDLNIILSKKSINWQDFEKVLRTKEKLIRILIASLNSTYAKPLNELLNEITNLFNQKLDEKFAEEHNIELEDLKKIKTFHWIFEFPEVFLKENPGFDVIVGNPPYGNILSKIEKDIYVNWKFNIAAAFIYRGINLLQDGSTFFSFIVPKSMSYSNGWTRVAELILPGLLKLVDCGKAFQEVKLEQVIFVLKKQEKTSNYIIGTYDNVVQEECLISKSIFRQWRVLLTGLRKKEVDIIKYLTNTHMDRWGNLVDIQRGLNWQAKVKNFQGNIPVFRGEQLKRYFLLNPRDFVDLSKFEKKEYEYQLKPKILNQLAIAHVQKPYPHFLIQAIYEGGHFLVYETISCTFAKRDKVNLKSLLMLNNSKLFAWIVYKFIYSNAIRSTRYDHIYISKVPLPRLTKSFYIIAQEISNYLLFLNAAEERRQKLKDMIEFFDRQIADSLVYELYFKEKFAEDGLYPEPKEYLLKAVSKHLKPINYDRWAELYWKKQLEGSLKQEEEKELEKLERENMEVINEVYRSLTQDKEVEKWIEKIKSHKWVKVIEGE